MIITIARQLGSGGASVGQLVAERLSIPYVDRQLLQRAAQLASVSEEAMEYADERRPSLLERMSAFIVGYQAPLAPEYAPPEAVFLPQLAYDSYRQLVEGAILEIANGGSAVIVGRGGQVILRQHPRALHVFIYAPDDARVDRLMERQQVTAARAKQLVRESDQHREGYLRTYYGAEWQDPDLYDLIVNTARIGMAEAAELIVQASQSLAEEKAVT
ncbi:MAG: cytidylate kinase-like family protein [Chloroflexota bacterium]